MGEKKQSKKQESRAVVVTTAHRGVFFGYTTDPNAEVVKLEKARLCLYWSRDVKGFMGLAATGPTKDCRIGPAVGIDLRGVTSVLYATPEAVAAWEKAPWS